MPTQLNPYLNFQDDTREAMEFYQGVFGGELRMSTFKEFHASQDPSEDDKIRRAVLEAENGIAFMAAIRRTAWPTRPAPTSTCR